MNTIFSYHRHNSGLRWVFREILLVNMPYRIENSMAHLPTKFKMWTIVVLPMRASQSFDKWAMATILPLTLFSLQVGLVARILPLTLFSLRAVALKLPLFTKLLDFYKNNVSFLHSFFFYLLCIYIWNKAAGRLRPLKG